MKVQFFWDRYGAQNETSSCWVRVSSPWAGKSFGFVQLPRIGQEVIVDFLEGDPDQPIITGRVYNAEQMPPWELPANATQSGVLTRSSKGGAYGNARVGDSNAERVGVSAGRVGPPVPDSGTYGGARGRRWGEEAPTGRPLRLADGRRRRRHAPAL